MYRRLKFTPGLFAHVPASPFNDQRCARIFGPKRIRYFGVASKTASQTNT